MRGGSSVHGWICLVVVACGAAACEDGDKEDASDGTGAATGPIYRATCEVDIEQTAALPTFEATGRGVSMEAAEVATWAILCPQAGLPPDCGTNLPDGLQRASWACMGLSNFEGTGIALADPATHQCTISVQDTRSRQRAHGVAERIGTDAETAEPEALCAGALEQACQQVGAVADCTTGDAATFRLMGQSSSRALETGAGGR